PYAVYAQRDHAARERHVHDLLAVGAAADLAAHRVVDHEQLVDSDTAGVPSFGARLATRLLVEHRTRLLARLLADVRWLVAADRLDVGVVELDRRARFRTRTAEHARPRRT